MKNDASLQSQLEQIVRDFGADSGTVHVNENGILMLRASVGIPDSVKQIVAQVPIGKGMAGLAAQRNAPVSSCNIQSDKTGDVRPGARATGLSGALVLPIRDAGGSVRGTLGIGVQREYTYTEDETKRLFAAASTLVF
jgi:putative methionine-R-sulfoxide reductase with GAF domain